MKIAYVCPFYEPTICGVKQVVKELAERMVERGHEVHVFTSDWDKYQRIKIREEVINGVRVHRCVHILRVANFATVWPSVFWKLLNEDFDLIHTHLFGHAHTFLAALVAKVKNIPHIHTTHCPWSDAYRSPIGRVLLWISYGTLSRLSLKWAERVIAITPWEIDFIKKFGGDENKIIVLPNGMDDILFERIKPNNFKRKYRIEGKLALFFGRFNVTKGPEKLAVVAKDIVKERKDITFVFVGPDEGKKKEVQDIIKNQKNILLLDPIRDKRSIAEMYQAADVYVLPSYREGLPLTLFEAMCSGLPIVASPVNGIPYEMKDPENGFFVNYGDLVNLRRKILKILDNKKIAEKMRINNLKKAEKYSWDLIGDQTEEIYLEAVKWFRYQQSTIKEKH
ncbi:MAG: glycosyltransferase family 4 protein [Candidatus Woesearchaeota archaeon]